MSIYLAYGSNLNLRQMYHRCPNSKLIGHAWLPDQELLYKGSGSGYYLTTSPCSGKKIPIGVFNVSKEDEYKLDRYEGYPVFYKKCFTSISYTDYETDEVKNCDAFFYYLPDESPLGAPTQYYVDVCKEGYKDLHFDTKYLDQALDATMNLMIHRSPKCDY